MQAQTLLPEEYYKNLYKIPFAVGIVLFDTEQRILLLKPTYQEGYLIPGGMAEEHESPLRALQREVKEELDFTISQARLLCIDYKKIKQMGDNPILQFVFAGEPITEDAKSRIQLSDEHEAFGFYSIDKAMELVSPRLAQRLDSMRSAFVSGACLYLENGEIPITPNYHQ